MLRATIYQIPYLNYKIMAARTKRLTKDIKNKMVSGVVAGFANYMGIDTTLLRLLFAFFVVFTGFFPGVVLYVIAAVVMPEK